MFLVKTIKTDLDYLMNRILIIFLLTVGSVLSVFSQSSLGSLTGDESAFYAQTKQVNQFFRRFNNEENRLGVRYYPGDSLYRDGGFRQTYLNMIFDQSSIFIDKDTKKEFIDDVTRTGSPKFLEFHGGLWFAEAATTFNYFGNNENLLLFLQLEKENLGSKWVITNVYFNRFLRLFYKGEETEIDNSFLHPMSHELDFMNIYKTFRDKNYLEYYASQTYHPDYLTLLFYEIKNGNMSFVNVGQVKFHFFQIEGWYFELSYFNRPGNNSGWLISKLFRITEKEKEELIKFYLP
jgi:hypothetical protein